MKKSIGILGGMGPMATADLFQKITALTAASCDREHIRIYIDSNPAIPDRTAAILEGGEDPLPAMTDALRHLEACGADCLIMPCNTAHYFLPRLQPLTEIPFLSMTETAARRCRELHPGRTVPEPEEREALMQVIYGGVKAGADPEQYRKPLETVLAALSRRGADYFLPACTELPLAFQSLGLACPAVDPTLELARAAVLYCGYPVKE